MLALLAAAWLLPRPAAAHAVVIESTPAAGATVPPDAVDVSIRYNSRIDHKRSKLSLRLPDKSVRALALDMQSPPNLLQARAGTLTPGAYRLQWQVLAVDGHITRGEIAFTVKGP